MMERFTTLGPVRSGPRLQSSTNSSFVIQRFSRPVRVAPRPARTQNLSASQVKTRTDRRSRAVGAGAAGRCQQQSHQGVGHGLGQIGLCAYPSSASSYQIKSKSRLGACQGGAEPSRVKPAMLARKAGPSARLPFALRQGRGDEWRAPAAARSLCPVCLPAHACVRQPRLPGARP